MKHFFKILVVVGIVFICRSCTKDTSIEESNLEVTIEDEFKNGILSGSWDIFINSENPFFTDDRGEINLTQDKSSFDDFLLELVDFEYFELKDQSFEGINFKVENRSGNIVVSNLMMVKSDDQYFLDNRGVGCPPGTEKVKKCTSKKCVKKTLTTLGDNMRSGDSFSAHRKRTGVIICANRRLIKQAFPVEVAYVDEQELPAGGGVIDSTLIHR